ncbi:unannotated protein [freshwater metagenome]|uniref:Unannotated protein n=1 Tax=freshwater metagenome TaxID=449393 RepID=A0A6J7FE92_9ZZZZ|nr:hypothetical protein [Actinomycetota bacterium]
MELSPQSVSSTTFRIVKKGYDPEQVKSYLADLASSIEVTQNQASAMEARARAAISRLQELSAQAPPAEAAPVVTGPVVTGEAENISRTLLLAQRAADAAIADATAEAEGIVAKATAHSQSLLEGTQEIVNRLVEESSAEARRAGEAQRVQVESEVQALLARREFLLADVEQLDQHIVTQRERLRDVASELSNIVAKVPGGLADLRRPLMSAVEAAAPVAVAAPEPEPVADAPDGHGAIAELEVGEDATVPMVRTEHSDQLVPFTSAAPVVLTPMVERAVDTIWTGRPSDEAPWTPVAEPNLLDGLDAITEEVPAVRQERPNDVTIRGEELA